MDNKGEAWRLPIRLSLVLDFTSVGGAELLLLDLFRHFDRQVVQPRVVCLRTAGELAQDFADAGVPVEVLHRTGRYDMRTLPRLVRSLRTSRTDVVLVPHHHRAALTLGRLAARLAGVRANVIAPHAMDIAKIGQRCLPRHIVETLFLSDALVLVASSQGDYLHREEGVGRFPWRRTREVVIPNGIRLPPPSSRQDRQAARTSLGLHDDDLVVGIVARLAVEKAHEVLLGAIARLAPTHPRLRLVVVGDGERATELQDLAAGLGIADRVSFLGVRRDVPAILPAFDVACLSSAFECVPLSVIESMAAGLPVVVTDCGALRDVVGHGQEGFIVPVGDVKALATRIGQLLADPQLRRSFGQSARDRCEREYRIEATAGGFERLLTSLVAS